MGDLNVVTVTLNINQHCAYFDFARFVPKDLHKSGPPVLDGR